MKFKTSLGAIAGVFIFHLMLAFTGGYGIWSSWDIPLHFAGGFTVAMLGISIHHAMTNRHHIKHVPLWYHSLFVISFVIFVAVAWEFYEYIYDNTFRIWYDLAFSQISLTDTMGDLAMGFIGGTVAFFSFKKAL